MFYVHRTQCTCSTTNRRGTLAKIEKISNTYAIKGKPNLLDLLRLLVISISIFMLREKMKRLLDYFILRKTVDLNDTSIISYYTIYPFHSCTNCL